MIDRTAGYIWSREGSRYRRFSDTYRILWQQKWYDNDYGNRFQISESSDEPDVLHLIDAPDNEMDITRDEARRLAGILVSWADGTLGMPVGDLPLPEHDAMDSERIDWILREAAVRNDAGRVMVRRNRYKGPPDILVVWERPYDAGDLARFQDDCGELGGIARFASAAECVEPCFPVRTVYIRNRTGPGNGETR